MLDGPSLLLKTLISKTWLPPKAEPACAYSRRSVAFSCNTSGDRASPAYVSIVLACSVCGRRGAWAAATAAVPTSTPPCRRLGRARDVLGLPIVPDATPPPDEPTLALIGPLLAALPLPATPAGSAD